MTALLRAGIAVAFCACVAGCAVPGTPSVTTAVTPDNIISPDSARNAITVGKSTKTEVIAALGRATVISFDTGFEVWVYQVNDETPAAASRPERIGRAGPEQGNLANTEFVVLFDPTGVVTKTRIRVAPPLAETTGR